MNLPLTNVSQILKRALRIDIESLSLKEHLRENTRDLQSGHNNHPYVNIAIDSFKNAGGSFNGFALTESSVRSFFYNLLQVDRPEYAIVELGGGQSTLFMKEISQYFMLKLFTYEHDLEWASFLKSRLAESPNIKVFYSPLRQVSDNLRRQIFEMPKAFHEIWNQSSSGVLNGLEKDLFLKNSFYNIDPENLPNHGIDGLIVDGPHGDGRSMCFPLFHTRVHPGTIVLIDDYHHYPFLDDMGRIFTYKIIEKRKYKYSNKGWVLVKVIRANK